MFRLHTFITLTLLLALAGGMVSCIDDAFDPCQTDEVNAVGNVDLQLSLTVLQPDASASTRAALNAAQANAARNTRADNTNTRADDSDDHTTNDGYTETFQHVGTADENRMYSLTVFLVPLKDDGSENLTTGQVQHTTVYVTDLTDGIYQDGALQGYRLTVNFQTNFGKKHIYVGANLQDDQIAAFCNGNSSVIYSQSEAPDLKTIMNHFMQVSDERFTYTGSRISMFAQALNGTSPDFNITPAANPATSPYAGDALTADLAIGTITLERTVAKVLMACKRSDDTNLQNEYIDIRDVNETARISKTPTDAEKTRLKQMWRGWVHDSTVFYMVNIAARAQRLHNDSVATFGKYVRRLQDYDFVSADESVYTRRYLSHNSEELSFTANGADIYPFVSGALRRRAAVWYGETSAPTYLSNTWTYDADGTPQVDNTPQTQDDFNDGIYCLPNLFRFTLIDPGDAGSGTDDPSASGTATDATAAEWYEDGFKLDSVAQKIATYVVVAVRYIPKTLNVLVETEDETGKKVGTIKEHTFATMQSVLDSLPAVKVPSTSGTTAFPAGTYWALVKTTGATDYYTAAAMQHKVEEMGAGSWSLARFRCYERGYSYYISFIDPLWSQDSDSPFYHRNSYDYDVKYVFDKTGVDRQDRVFGLSRNHYYLLRASEIQVPGSSTLSGPMCLNAVLVDWNNVGQQVVDNITPGEY